MVSVHILDAAGFHPDDPDLDGVVLVDFDAFTTWRTEDQLLVGHAHDPFKRIDVMASGRQVEVRLGDVILASSKRALALWETHLPVRWYLPHDDVRMDLLEPSDHRTTCAYKGHATYLSIRGGERDIAWQYVEPLNDAARVAGYVCFWNERTDLFLDGLENSPARYTVVTSRGSRHCRARPAGVRLSGSSIVVDLRPPAIWRPALSRIAPTR